MKKIFKERNKEKDIKGETGSKQVKKREKMNMKIIIDT